MIPSQTSFELEEILPILPHRPPFLFVDRVRQIDPGKSIVAERMLRANEPQFAGHFPGRPIMPGVLVGEALAQTCGLLLGLSEKIASTGPPPGPRNFVLARTHLKFTYPAVPGDVLELRAGLERSFAGLFRFEVEALAARNVIAAGSVTLAEVKSGP